MGHLMIAVGVIAVALVGPALVYGANAGEATMEMEVEIHVDWTAYHQYRRGVLMFALAAALFMPTVLLVLSCLAAVLGREAVEPYTGAASDAGFLAVLATFWYGAWHSLIYHCPRCGRRLPRVVPRDDSRPNIHYHCANCRIVWDLGWGWGESA